MIPPISFVFSTSDPQFTSKVNVVSAFYPYIAHISPISPMHLFKHQFMTKPPEIELDTK
jgi:hypothetical protein